MKFRLHLLIILIIISLNKSSQGYSVSTKSVQVSKTPSQLKSRTFEHIDEDKVDYATTGIVFGPIILLIIGALAIPVTLVVLVIFVIPIIAPYEGTEKRSLGFSPLDYLWIPVSLTQEILGATQNQCIERITCEIGKKTNNPLFSFSIKGLQEKLDELNLVSPSLKTKISRSYKRGKRLDSTCHNLYCKTLQENGQQRFLGYGLPQEEEADSIWDKIVKFWGGRYLFVRKLAENKDVKFYPYLPSLG